MSHAARDVSAPYIGSVMQAGLVAIVVARWVLGGLFVLRGLRYLALLRADVSILPRAGPAVGRLILGAGALVQIVGGILIVSDVYDAPAALVLAALTTIVTLRFLDFRAEPAGAARETLKRAAAINAAIVIVLVAGGITNP